MLYDAWRRLLAILASLQLAVLVIATLAAVLAAGATIETKLGRPIAQWYVYHAAWFMGLLALLGVNVLTSTLVRFPWRRKLSFLVTHIGILVLLAGSFMTLWYGREGTVMFQEGQTVDRVVLTDVMQLSVRWTPGQGKRLEEGFVFQPGPSDWAPGQTLPLSSPDDPVQLRVMRYLANAAADETWVDDPSPGGVPALRFALLAPGGAKVAEDWLAGDQLGAQVSYGPVQLGLYPLDDAALLDDFLHPPEKDLGKTGLLSIHYAGKTQRVPIDGSIGKKIPLGDKGLSIEIVRYLPNAHPDATGGFATNGDEPKDPRLEVVVHEPGVKDALREYPSAKTPLVNLDVIHGHKSPVKFWYHHPATNGRQGVEFVRTADGKLYARVGDNGRTLSKGEIKDGQRFDLPERFQFQLLRCLPNARLQVSFHSAEAAGDEEPPKPALLLQVKAGQDTGDVWLQQNDEVYGRRAVPLPHGQVALALGYDSEPLGFGLRLNKFKRDVNPGGMGNAAFASSVQLIDPQKKIDDTRNISMNEPLVYGHYTFFQSSFREPETPGGPNVSFLTAARDPGLLVKYLGSILLCLGTVAMFVTRSPWFKSLWRAP